jgi:2-polyprenyl-6-methoxyphenol hydroxylase-like FAD-dependent oxidoreductase
VSAGFDLVIGADGLHSTVRRLAFGPQDRFEKRLGYIVAVFEADGYQPRDVDVYVTYSEPGRMAGRVSLRYDKRLFLFVFVDTVDRKQQSAERFSSAFAPKTRLGLRFRNLVIKAAAIPASRLTLGRDIVDNLRLPDYYWPC